MDDSACFVHRVFFNALFWWWWLHICCCLFRLQEENDAMREQIATLKSENDSLRTESEVPLAVIFCSFECSCFLFLSSSLAVLSLFFRLFLASIPPFISCHNHTPLPRPIRAPPWFCSSSFPFCIGLSFSLFFFAFSATLLWSLSLASLFVFQQRSQMAAQLAENLQGLRTYASQQESRNSQLEKAVASLRQSLIANEEEIQKNEKITSALRFQLQETKTKMAAQNKELETEIANLKVWEDERTGHWSCCLLNFPWMISACFCFLLTSSIFCVGLPLLSSFPLFRLCAAPAPGPLPLLSVVFLLLFVYFLFS